MINLKKEFEKYLIEEAGISKGSLKFYRSDLSHFSGWLLLKLRSIGILVDRLVEAFGFINPRTGQDYKGFLIHNSASIKTINRRLSTLRHLAKFLEAKTILDFDFMESVGNVLPKKAEKQASFQALIEDFEKHLRLEKASKNTIKNYLSDIKQFMTWLETNQGKEILNQA